jgi:hypothetical protein|tara:strand:- start:201 stop:329 length:129 start_codon:yes stop_codon:yes gene_type:complete
MVGVFGNLAEVALSRTTSLVLLNKNWDECKEALLSRGSQSSE